jgi:chromate transporter
MIYFKLFISFFQIGLFSIGGGYASLPLIQVQIVDINKWLTMDEYTDLITISGMTPGPIAINSSTFVGLQVGGFLGAVVATLGCVLPSCIIVVTLAILYKKYKNLAIIQGILNGLRPAVVALIATSCISILSSSIWGDKIQTANTENINALAVFLILSNLIIIKKWKVNPLLVMAGSGVFSLIFYFIK